MSFLGTAEAKDTFQRTLERVRQWYGLVIVGYVVLPEHLHLLISEPERSHLAVALQMLKQVTARRLNSIAGSAPFWQRRYYDFNVWSDRKRIEELRYMHRNPCEARPGRKAGQLALEQLSPLCNRSRRRSGN